MWVARIVAWWLSKATVSLEARTILTNAVLDKLQARHLHAIITSDENGVLVNGERLEYERAILLRESAKGALNNQARQLVRESVMSLATTRGVLEGDTPEKLYFYRAAIWFGDQETAHLRILAQE